MFKKLKIGTKIFWAFMLIAIIGSASGIVSVFLINRISTDADMALANYGFATGDIGSAIIMVTDSRRLCRDVVNFNNKVDATNAAKELETVKQKYSEYFEIVKKSVVDKEGQAYINDIEKKAAYYNSVLDSIVVQASTASQAQRHALQNRMKSELDPAYNKLYDEYISLFEDKQTAGHALTEEFLLLSKFAIYGTIALTAGSIVFSLFLSFGIANGIAKPIRKAVGAAQNLDKGNLDITLDIESNDEIGMLSDTFLNMANGLKDIIEDINMLLGEMSIGNFRISSSCPKRYIGEYKKILDAINEINHKLSDALIDINVSSEQVSTGSNQVAIGSQALSQGATEQAASIEQLTHTIESISMQIGENSENCQHASLITNRTSDALNDGTVQMEEMIKAMVDISETSNEIEKIIKTIDDIAFQTNILALNAAVEAARAGSAGKGFAVVADEVRNLASKSAQAARNTTDLISRAVTSVEHGNRIASSTAKTINDVVLNASEVTKVVEKIAQASENQAISVMHVTEVMEQIATVVQTNSATAEESAAASEELSAQARMLKDLVATFILEDDREKEIEPICELETQTEKYN